MAKKTLSLIIILICATTLEAQTDSVAAGKLKNFVRNMQVFNRLVPQEKVYLHFDNTSYALGDTIWFKAYVVNASDFLPDTLSGVLYAELLNEKGKVLETKKLKIVDGQCNGEFCLNDTNVEYFAGFFEIRAYTKAMLNFGTETVFSRVFPIFNNPREDGQYTENDIKADLCINSEINLQIPLPNLRPVIKKRDKVNADFYPEGGNLITGLTSKVAFRIADDKGRPLTADVQICNPQGEILSSAATEHAGIGLVAYTPDGQNNRAKVISDNKEYLFDLPASKATGYVMQTGHFPGNTLIVQVEKSPQTPQSLLGLTVLCRGNVLFFQTIEPSEEPFAVKIPNDALGSGVNQITLFDAKGEIFAERLVFIMPKAEEQLRLEAVPNKPSYQPEELIKIDFSVTGNSLDKTANFSLSVRDGETMVQTNRENIYTNLLLSSDLKGFIENPEDYFHEKNPNLQTRKLDLLMMVQGWKRYEWQTMAGVKPFKPLYNREKQLIIKGCVVSSEGKNIELKASLINGNSQRMDGKTKTDKAGEFYIIPEEFYGQWTLNLRSYGLADATKIRLDRVFSPAPKNYAYSETTWKNNDGSEQRIETAEDDSIIKPIPSDNDSITMAFSIKTVEVKASKQKKKKEYIHPVGQEIDLAIDRGEKIPNNVHDYLAQYDKLYSFGQLADAQIGNGAVLIIDEVVTTPYAVDIDRRYFFDPKNKIPANFGGVDRDGRDYYENHYSFFYDRPYLAKFFHFDDGKLEAFDRITYRSGKRAYDITVKELTVKRDIRDVEKIVISGKRQQDSDNKLFTPIYIYPYNDYVVRETLGARNTTFDGFSVPKDFFHPKTDDEIYRPNEALHHRTLYWNPNVKTDAQGKASIRFYNNSYCRKINISAEGITKNGIPIVAQFPYKLMDISYINK